VKLEDNFVKGTVGAGGITNFRVVFVCWGVLSYQNVTEKY